MNIDLSYLSDPSVLHPGCEKPHAYFIPHDTAESARTGERGKSGRFHSLCGEWDFRWCPSVRELGDFLSTDAPAFTESIRVPLSWQMELQRDYDKPLYTNRRYPYPIDPPHVPDVNPCGLYHRRFTVEPAYLADREVYLNFEGVDSCFYLYVNGSFAAYSQVSHCTSEICVTKYLHEGENELHVVVFKWCDGSYLEDQDKIRLSGIFREVYLLSRDKAHLRDLYIRTTTAEDFSAASLEVETELTGEAEIAYALRDPDGAAVCEGKLPAAKTGNLSIPLTNPKLWSDETPLLYELLLTVGGETIRQLVGVRRYEIRNGVILVNGKAVKCKGVNRCECHPESGSAVPLAQTVKDLMILKANNINMIRTSHYPNDPRFYELCDEYGFYVCDEADIETHGLQFRTLEYPTHFLSWSALTDAPDWKNAYLDRAERVMERDKNFACVLFWSVGNECGVGANFRAMADYFHRRMPGCIVHSENLTRLKNLIAQGKLTKEEARWDRYGDFTDIDSRMYPPPREVKKYYFSENSEQKPFYLCEYSHAMGNGPGDLKDYWDLILANDRFFGGCVWELLDHAVNVGTPENPVYAYGGFGYPMNDEHYCVDGLLDPGRKLHTGMLEYRQILRPVRIEAFDFTTGRFAVRNMRYFTDLSDLDIVWKLERNGKTVAEGCIRKPAVEAQQSADYQLDPAIFRGLTGDCYLTFSYRQNTDRPWEKAGYEVGFDQFEAPSAEEPEPTAQHRALSLRKETYDVLISDGCTTWRVDLLRGLIAGICTDGKELLASPIRLNVWRAPTDNDMKLRPDWETALLPLADTRCDSCRIEEESAQRIVVASDLTLAAPSRRPILRAKLRYVFTDDGKLTVEQSYHVLNLADQLGDTYAPKDRPVQEECLPRLGLQFSMTEGAERLSWFGPGPTCKYADVGLAARMGRFESTVTEHFEHYVHPQENLAHDGTRRFSVCADDGRGLKITPAGDTKRLSFNCSHFTPDMLIEAENDSRLVPLKETVVNVDLAQTAIGSASCGAPVPEEERVGPGDYRFTIALQPLHDASDALA